MKINKEFIRNLVLYGLIGGFSSTVDVIVFILLNSRLNLNEFLSNAISVHIGILISFLLNSRFNFKKTDKLLKRLLSFYIVGLFGLLISSGMLSLGNALQLPINYVKIASVFIVAAIQFCLNKFLTFRG